MTRSEAFLTVYGHEEKAIAAFFVVDAFCANVRIEHKVNLTIEGLLNDLGDRDPVVAITGLASTISEAQKAGKLNDFMKTIANGSRAKYGVVK